MLREPPVFSLEPLRYENGRCLLYEEYRAQFLSNNSLRPRFLVGTWVCQFERSIAHCQKGSFILEARGFEQVKGLFRVPPGTVLLVEVTTPHRIVSPTSFHGNSLDGQDAESGSSG